MRRRAFTLVETLMALTLTAVLAAGGAMLVLEVTQAWARRETGPAFRRHVSGLGGFLETALEAGRGPAGRGAPRWEVPPGEPPATAPALHLVLPDLGLVAEVPPGTNPAGEGWLRWEREAGLVLLWRTFREKGLRETALHRTVLSRWCEATEFWEYQPGPDRWAEFSPGAAEAGRDIRRRAVFRLRRHGETYTLHLNLDLPAADAPAY